MAGAEGGRLAGSEGLCLSGRPAKMPGALLILTTLLGLWGPSQGCSKAQSWELTSVTHGTR